MNRIKRTEFLWSLGALLLLNLLFGIFLYEKSYQEFTLEIEVNSDYVTKAWFIIYPKFQNETYQTEMWDVTEETQKLSLIVQEPQGFQNIGFYWSRSDKGTFELGNPMLKVNDKAHSIEKLSDFIDYSSENLSLEIQNGKAIYSSIEKGNGWVMLNLERVEDHCKKKQFSFFPIWINGLLLALFFLFRKPIRKFIERVHETIVSFSFWERLRFIAIGLWCLLFAFWNQASHIFVALTMALTILHFINNREVFRATNFKPFLATFIFVLTVALINLVYFPDQFAKFSLPYVYFILVPLSFSGLSKTVFIRLGAIFQIGVLSYALMIAIASMARYVSYDASISFSSFFFLTVEQYWHSSYLANLISVAVLLRLFQRELSIYSWLWVFVAGVFMFISEARLPLLVMLLTSFLLLITRLFHNHKKIFWGVAIIMGMLMISIIPFQTKIKDSDVVKKLMFSKTEKMDARVALWKESISLLEENKWYGMGPGNVRNILSKNLPNDSKLKLRNYNAHNQYLEIALSYGWVSLLLFVLLLSQPLSNLRGLYPCFMVYVALVMLVESYLARQAGIVFFSFWYTFMIYYDRSK